MRTVLLSLLTCLASTTGFSQQSLCNPCVDPPNLSIEQDLRRLEVVPVLTPDQSFDLGAAISNLRSLTLVDSRRPMVDAALQAAARTAMPQSMTELEVTDALGGGLWRQDAMAVAVSVPQGNGSLTFVFARQPDGSFSATDASRTIANAAFGFFGWPAGEYERFLTEPLEWRMADNEVSLLYVRVSAWRQGQRYTVNGRYLVGPDGSVTAP